MTVAPSPPPDGHDSPDDLAARVASIRVDDQNGNGGYASIPPPGSRTYSPPSVVTQQHSNPGQLEQQVNYGYRDETHYLEYQHAMPMHVPPFSPILSDWNGQLNGSPYQTFAHLPVQTMPLGPMSPPSHHMCMPVQQSQHAPKQGNEHFTTLADPFVQLTPISELRNQPHINEDEDGRRPRRVYRPPHIALQDQTSRHGQPRNMPPRMPQTQRQYNMAPRNGRKEQMNGSGEWVRGGRNGQNGNNGFKMGFNNDSGKRRRYSSVSTDAADVPYTPQPHNPTIDRIFIPQHDLPASPMSSPQSPLQSLGLSASAPLGRQLGGRLGQFSGGPMGQFGANSSQTGQAIPYTPPSLRNSGSGQPQRQAPRYPGQRSSLLEDFRINRTDRQWDVQDMTGYIVEFAGDQHGSRFIQTKIADANPRERQKIFDEIMPDILTLMQDVFGNYVVQKMFEVGDLKQIVAIAKKMEGRVLSLSMHMYGCRVVQKAVAHLPPEQRTKLITELEPHILECVHSNNANHVVQPPKSLSKALAGHFQELAMNPFGCRVIQKMFEQLDDEWKREMLEEMHPIALALMENQYGNYVVQSVITVGPDRDRQKLVDILKGKMLALSRHKFASNVCEKALQHATAEDRRALIDELIAEQADGSTAVPMLLGDAFGNFPLQFALTCADDDQRAKILDLIIAVLPSFANTPVGRRLSTQLTQWEADGLIASSTEPGANVRAYEESRAAEKEKGPQAAPDGVSSRSSVAHTESESSDDDEPPSQGNERDALRSSASTPVRRVREKMENRGRALSRTGSSTVIPPARSASTSKTSSRNGTNGSGANGDGAMHDDDPSNGLPN